MIGHTGQFILSHSGQFNRTNCDSCIHLPKANSWEKIGQHFPLRVRENCCRTYRRKTDSILSFSYTKFTPKNYNRLSLNYGTLLANHSAVPRPLRQLQCILTPPPDICLRSMGRCTLLLCPSPGSLRDLRVWGGWR